MSASRPLTLLLSGAGGAASAGLATHLRRQGCRVLMADMDRHAEGLCAGDRGFVIPAAQSPDFVPVVRGICEREGVDIFAPLVDEELLPAQDVASATTQVLTPREAFIRLCLDKYTLMQRLAAEGIRAPGTWAVGEHPREFERPLILKPRTGRGSRGVALVRDRRELAEAVSESAYQPEELLLQEYIDGPEFTVSVVAWRDGEVQAVVPKEIIVKRGITRLAVTRRHAGIDALCRRLQSTLRADGPFNVQLRLHPVTGEALLFEINPRYSTTISLTMAAGIDELYGLAMQAAHGRAAHEFGPWRDGLVLRRRSVDEFVDEAEYLRTVATIWEPS